MKKKLLSILVSFSVVLTLMLAMAMTAMAADKEEGIKAEQTVNTSNGNIEVTLKVTAEDGYSIEGVTLKNQKPDGYKLLSGEAEVSEKVIQSGNSKSLTTVFTKDTGAVNTGDSNSNGILLFGGLAILSAALIILLITRGKKWSKKIFTLFLCGVLVASSAITFAGKSYAYESEGKQIELSKDVTIGSETITVKSVVSYDRVIATTYKVTFDLNGITGTTPDEQTIIKGKKVTKPANPTDTIHSFAGWYKTKDTTTGILSDPWDFDTDVVTGNMTLYAQWTRTLGSIIETNQEFPAPTTDLNIPPSNAWENRQNQDCKAFVCTSAKGDALYLKKINDNKNSYFTTSDAFTKVNNNYEFEGNGYKATCTMKDGKFVSFEYEDTDPDYAFLSGTYSAPTFKAVYDKNGGANKLTFYYDSKDHSGNNINVYENLPTNATAKTSWGYNNNRSYIKSVVIDSSVANYHALTSIAYMFFDMKKAENITGAEYLDVSNVWNMTSAFSGYGAEYTTLNAVPNVSGWNTQKVKYMSGMFENYGRSSTNLKFNLDLSSWSVAEVTSYGSMFKDAGANTNTWSVTIPAKTGNRENNMAHWYVGDGTDTSKFIVPANSKQFTKKAEIKSIGGKIFHVVNGDNGATYHFYKDAAGTEEITGWTDVASLADAKYYSIVGTPTSDKFYVMGTDGSGNPLTVKGKWGETEVTNVTANTVGSGKTNTNALIGLYGERNETIWAAVKSLRTAAGGHDDWFVGTNAEQHLLITSGFAGNLYNNDTIAICSSVECSSEYAYKWNNSYSYWEIWYKLYENLFDAVALRAF